MTTPVLLHPDADAAAEATNREWRRVMTGSSAYLGRWVALRTATGSLLVSVRVNGPDPATAMRTFASWQSLHLADQSQRIPGDQLPTYDYAQPGRVACAWRTGGVWVELWHPDTTRARVVSAPVLKKPGRCLTGLAGARLPFTRRTTAAKEN
jgi:hypothetical protein